MDNTQNCIIYPFAFDSINMVRFTIETSFNLDHPNFKQVIEIAEEIISENQILTLDKLYKRAKQHLKISRSGLKSIIQYLVTKKFIIDQSRFTRVSVLSNQFRKMLYSIICNNIGIHLSAVRKLFQDSVSNIGVGQLLWHIDMLIKFGYIKSIKVGNFLILLPIKIDDDYGRICFFYRDELNRKILSLLNSNDQIKRSEIYKSLNESRESIYYHVKNLIEYEILLILDNSIININPDKAKTLDLVINGGKIII